MLCDEGKLSVDDTIDKFIPFGGVALIAAVYVEGAFRILQLFA